MKTICAGNTRLFRGKKQILRKDLFASKYRHVLWLKGPIKRILYIKLTHRIHCIRLFLILETPTTRSIPHLHRIVISHLKQSPIHRIQIRVARQNKVPLPHVRLGQQSHKGARHLGAHLFQLVPRLEVHHPRLHLRQVRERQHILPARLRFVWRDHQKDRFIADTSPWQRNYWQVVKIARFCVYVYWYHGVLFICDIAMNLCPTVFNS